LSELISNGRWFEMKFFYGFLIMAVLIGNVSATETHSGKKVSIIHSGDNRGCIFFQLEGVEEADPVYPNGGAWFAVSNTHESSEKIFSMLIASKTGDTTVRVKTSADHCDGHALVHNLFME
jgi:hypothetical protein